MSSKYNESYQDQNLCQECYKMLNLVYNSFHMYKEKQMLFIIIGSDNACSPYLMFGYRAWRAVIQCRVEGGSGLGQAPQPLAANCKPH